MCKAQHAIELQLKGWRQLERLLLPVGLLSFVACLRVIPGKFLGFVSILGTYYMMLNNFAVNGICIACFVFTTVLCLIIPWLYYVYMNWPSNKNKSLQVCDHESGLFGVGDIRGWLQPEGKFCKAGCIPCPQVQTPSSFSL